MTNTPVKDVGFGQNGLMTAVGMQNRMSGDFQAVWNNQRPEGTADSQNRQDLRPVKKTSYDSMKARDEHRARTEKREPSRNVEERTDISEETAEVLASSAVQNQTAGNRVAEEISTEALQALEEAGVEAVAMVAEAFGMTEAEVREAMATLGMENADLLNPEEFSKLLMAAAGEQDTAVLVTDEELYAKYRELMQQLEGLSEQTADRLNLSAEQLGELAAKAQSKDIPVSELKADGEQDGSRQEMISVSAEGNSVTERNQAGIASGLSETAENGPDSRSGRESAGKNGTGGNNAEGVNLFTQNLRTQQAVDGAQQPIEVQGGFSTETQDIMRQIMDYMRVNLKGDMSTMERQLHPESLGSLHVQVASKEGVVTANFIAQNETVKAALEGQMIQLKEQFAEQGVKVEAIEVSVQTRQYEQNPEQDRNNESRSRESSGRGRVRRINLMEEINGEEPSEEDLLARDMMERNGNTVDYTA